jgi:hypothetical protein
MWELREMHIALWLQYLKEVDHLEDVAAGNEMILNWILKVQVGRVQMQRINLAQNRDGVWSTVNMAKNL